MGPRPDVVDEVLVALASGDALTVIDVLADREPTPTEIAAAEALIRLDEWLDMALGPWLATYEV